ncbi:MAG: PKD domain-containing protein [Flavobacteriales bacterium]|nr:PKD domain-containing protein [Flavobacteriales bacterium]
MKKITLFIAACGLFIGASFGQNIVQKQQIQQYQAHQLNRIQSLSQNQTISDEDRLAQYPKTPSGHIRCIAPDYHEGEAQFENWINEKIKEINLSNNQALKATRNIPVVVHVLHNGDAVGSGENISVAQIQSQIDALNEDYSATNSDFGNTPTVFQSAAGNMDIQFCLALTDPNGNATTGIDRINIGVASVSDTDIETNYGLNNMWDPTKYLNIFVGNISGGLLGKAVFPTGSGLGGMPGGSAPAYDGVMCGATAFGRVGTAAYPYNKGRSATHEIGHWLGLRHIWGDGTCATDYCSDTPPAQTSNFGCQTFPYNTGACSGNTTGEMTMNYMDYSDDACMYMFTNDQKARMDAVLLNSPQRKELLTSNKCMPPAITADFIADITNVNVGGTVNFTDQSVSPNTLNSWTWSFPGGTPSSYVGQTPPAIQYNTPGLYDVTLTVTDNMSASDGETKTGYINVYIAGVCDTLNNPPAGTIVSYTTTDGYLAGWNEYADISKAELIPGNATYPYVTGGLFGIRSAHDGGNGATVDFNIWDNTGAAGAPGAIIGSVTVPLASLDFNTSGYENSLIEIMFNQAVNVGSNDFYFGFTMNGFQASDTLGMFSNTDGDSSPGTAWEQWSDNSWNTDAASWGINITQYFAPYLSQNIPTAAITTNTTTICAGETVDFDASTSTNTTGYDWIFNGGSPSTSTNTAETVTYAAAGSPRAYLVAYGNCGAIAIDSVDITVNTPVVPTFTQLGPYCIGETPATLPTTSTNGISGTWDAAISTASAGTTTYTFTPTGGCATTATMDVVVIANVTPTFTQAGPYCVGDTPATLPTTSTNGVVEHGMRQYQLQVQGQQLNIYLTGVCKQQRWML